MNSGNLGEANLLVAQNVWRFQTAATYCMPIFEDEQCPERSRLWIDQLQNPVRWLARPRREPMQQAVTRLQR